MKSIQTKFIVLILGCILLSSAVIGGAGILNAKRVIDEDSAKIMNLLCAKKTQEINALLSRIQQSVRTLAVYAVGQLESVERLKADGEYLSAYTKTLETVAVNAANNTEGAMAVYIRFNPAFTTPTSGLFWSKTTVDGSLRQLVPTDLSKFSPSDTEHVGWYYVPIRNGKATWMNPYLNKNINVHMISFVIPLYMNNQTVGIVGMDIDFSVITDIVKGMQIYQSGYAFLTDKAANIMYHREFEHGTPLAVADSALHTVAMEIQNGTSGSSLFSYRRRNEDKKMAFRTLSNGMTLAISSPISEIHEARDQLALQIWMELVVIATFSVMLTIFMTRRLTRPLRELNEAAKKIAAGDLSISITQQTKDEVGTLAESFQQTVQHLQKYINYINGLAYKDSLTGVKNKAAYLDTKARYEEEMRLGKPEFAVVVLDINGLKEINDNHGHDLGDMLIISASQLICKTFPHIPVYRIGGDEFTVILEKSDYEHYPELLKRLQEKIDLYNRSARADTQVSIASGIAIYNSETDQVFANVFKRADDAMYQNKAAMKAQKRMQEDAAASCEKNPPETDGHQT